MASVKVHLTQEEVAQAVSAFLARAFGSAVTTKLTGVPEKGMSVEWSYQTPTEQRLTPFNLIQGTPLPSLADLAPKKK